MKNLWVLAMLALLSTQAMAYEVPNIAAAGSRSRILSFDTLEAREANLAKREMELAKREAELTAREAALAVREESIASREACSEKSPEPSTETKTERKPDQYTVRRGAVRYGWGGLYSRGACASGACGR